MSPTIIPSIFIFYGILSWAYACLLILGRNQANKVPVSYWACGAFLTGFATFITVFRSESNLLFTYVAANGITFTGYLCFNYALQSMWGSAASIKKNISISSAAFLGYCIALDFIGIYLEPKYQTVFVSAMASILFLCAGFLGYKIYKKNHIKDAAVLSAAAFALGIFWAARIPLAFSGAAISAFSPNSINTIIFVCIFLLGIFWYFIFNALLYSEAHKTELKVLEENNLLKLELAQRKAEQSEFQLLTSLNALSKARDNETGNHIIRTQNYVKVLALRLRDEGHYVESLSDQSIDLLFKAAPLHDIGKIGIPDHILLKNGSFTDEEWEIMKTHSMIGESVLCASNINMDANNDVMAKAIKIAGGHHEKWDGTGYPRGLTGEAIPLEARIMSLADMYDALVNKRVYKKAWTHEQAAQEILSKRGTQFDPLVVDAFIAEQDVFRDIAQKYEDS